MPIVAGAGVVLLALMALLLMYGAAQLGKILANVFPSNIGVGVLSIHPRAWVEAGINAVLAGVQWIVGDVIRPMIGFVLRPALEVFNFVHTVERFAIDAASTVYWIVNDGIPQAVSAVVSWAAGRVAVAMHYALALYHDAQAYAAHLYYAAEAHAVSLYHAALRYAVSAAVSAEHYALNLFRSVTSTAASDLAAAKAYAFTLTHSLAAAVTRDLAALSATVAADVSLAEAYADTKVADAVRALEADLATATAATIRVVDVDSIAGVAALYPGLLDDVTSLEGLLGTDLPDIGAALRAIPRAVPADLAQVLTAAGAISVPMLRYMLRCGIPNCRNLSNFGRLLQDLLGILESGEFLALLVGLIRDPKGAAQELAAEWGGIAADVTSTVRNLVGV